MKLLLVDAPGLVLPDALEAAARDAGWEVTHATSCPGLSDALLGCDAAMLAIPQGSANERIDRSEFRRMVECLDAKHVPTLIYAAHPTPALLPSGEFVEVVGPDFSPAELRGRFAMIERYHGHIGRLERELTNMERLTRQINDHFQDLDQEMRLAARLQRGFLPRIADPIAGVRFASLFRPATWVSGDFFDVFRVDEEHTAFYLADAVGHGVASGLLTIFIKQGMIARESDNNTSRLLGPDETLTRLNNLLFKQSLPNCQFVTAWYGLLNHRTLRLRYARAGHPYPVLMSHDGTIKELESGGGLLGIMEEESYDAGEIQLAPGDKLVVFSDGLECCLPELSPPAKNGFDPVNQLAALGEGPMAMLIDRLEQRINDHGGSLNPQDDITILGMEVLQPQE